jgi:uncharacterized protein YndB with AHSA1/START domain
MARTRRAALAAIIGLASAAPGTAEVKSATAGGFEVEARATVAATPAQTYRMLGRIGEWWNDDHTYSGKAANMRLQLRAGGCFCETIPADGGSIEHGRIIYARPGEALRLQGALGPLQPEAAIGTLTWSLKAVPGGTEVVQTYVAGGYVRGGADKLAPIVDRVMAEQLAGLQRRLARRP